MTSLHSTLQRNFCFVTSPWAEHPWAHFRRLSTLNWSKLVGTHRSPRICQWLGAKLPTVHYFCVKCIVYSLWDVLTQKKIFWLFWMLNYSGQVIALWHHTHDKIPQHCQQNVSLCLGFVFTLVIWSQASRIWPTRIVSIRGYIEIVSLKTKLILSYLRHAYLTLFTYAAYKIRRIGLNVCLWLRHVWHKCDYFAIRRF